MNTSVSGGAPG